MMNAGFRKRRRMAAVFAASAFGLLALVVQGISGSPAPANAGANSAPKDADRLTITIKDYDFTPHELDVPVGSKVTWVNKDEEAHKVAEVKGAFTSPPLDTDQTFTYEFKTPGTYEYFCTLHPQMTGKVVAK